MYLNAGDITLGSRLTGVSDAQKRARAAFFILLYATAAMVFGLWNMYLSWERQWAYVQQPTLWAQQQVVTQQIKSWVDGQSIGISLLGLRVSVSDINVLGSFALLTLSYYYCMCARRENHEIGILLRETKELSIEIRQHIMATVKSGMVIHPTSDNDTPFQSLNDRIDNKQFGIFRSLQSLFIYFPVAAIFIGLISDIYFCFFYTSPWRNNSEAAWNELLPAYQWQLLLMDVFGIAMGIFTYKFSKYSSKYNGATHIIYNEYVDMLPTHQKE